MEQRAEFRLWKILGEGLQAVDISGSPKVELVLKFSNGFRLNLPCDDHGYGDWCIAGEKGKMFSEETRLTIFSAD